MVGFSSKGIHQFIHIIQGEVKDRTSGQTSNKALH
jgi:hypothetical protein